MAVYLIGGDYEGHRQVSFAIAKIGPALRPLVEEWGVAQTPLVGVQSFQ
jgi:hypothetical protein